MFGIELLAVMALLQEPQGWDCENLSGSMSQMIGCGADEIRAESARLTEYLNAARAVSFVGGEASVQSAFLDGSQTAWEAYAEIQCRAEAQRHSGGMIETILYQGCLREMTRDRTREIWRLYLRGDDGQQPVLPQPTGPAD